MQMSDLSHPYFATGRAKLREDSFPELREATILVFRQLLREQLPTILDADILCGTFLAK
jgi:hypothetical protein